MLLIVFILFRGLKTRTTLRDLRFIVLKASSTSLYEVSFEMIIKTYPATTTVASIRFHPLRKYELGLMMNPLAIILNMASNKNKPVNAMFALSMT